MRCDAWFEGDPLKGLCPNEPTYEVENEGVTVGLCSKHARFLEKAIRGGVFEALGVSVSLRSIGGRS